MLPKKKISKTRTRTRRSHNSLTVTNYSLCKKCGDSKLPHAACAKCGYHNSSITLDLAEGDNS